MSTTPVESWAVDLSTIGPIYPFVGSELILVLVGVACWIAWHVWQIRTESRQLEQDSYRLRQGRELRRALEREHMLPKPNHRPPP